MRKVFAHFNQPPCSVEKNDGISLTEPEQSMTIEEIIESFMNGVIIEPDADAMYDGDDDLDTGVVDVFDDVLDAIDHAPEPEPSKEPESEPSKEPDPVPSPDQA